MGSLCHPAIVRIVADLCQRSSGSAGFDSSSIEMRASRANRGTSISSKESRKPNSGFGPRYTLHITRASRASALRELLTLIETNRELIEKAWDEFFG